MAVLVVSLGRKKAKLPSFTKLRVCDSTVTRVQMKGVGMIDKQYLLSTC